MKLVLRTRLNAHADAADAAAWAAEDRVFPADRAHAALALDLRDRQSTEATGAIGWLYCGVAWVELAADENLRLGDADVQYDPGRALDDADADDPRIQPGGSLAGCADFHELVWDGDAWQHTFLIRAAPYLTPAQRVINAKSGRLALRAMDVELKRENH